MEELRAAQERHGDEANGLGDEYDALARELGEVRGRRHELACQIEEVCAETGTMAAELAVLRERAGEERRLRLAAEQDAAVARRNERDLERRVEEQEVGAQQLEQARAEVEAQRTAAQQAAQQVQDSQLELEQALAQRAEEQRAAAQQAALQLEDVQRQLQQAQAGVEEQRAAAEASQQSARRSAQQLHVTQQELGQALAQRAEAQRSAQQQLQDAQQELRGLQQQLQEALNNNRLDPASNGLSARSVQQPVQGRKPEEHEGGHAVGRQLRQLAEGTGIMGGNDTRGDHMGGSGSGPVTPRYQPGAGGALDGES